MLLYYDDRIYICRSTYFEKEIPRQAGFRWDPTNKRWWTDKDSYAFKLIQYADDVTKVRLRQLIQDQSESLKLSRAVDAKIEVPAPKGLQYLPFQKAGVAYAFSRPAVLIGDEMGLGKTIEAIGVINAGSKPKSVLIVCPATLKGNWKKELEKWLVYKLRVGVVMPKDDWPYAADVVILNYDILDRYQKEIRERNWDYFICDEAHYLKNMRTKRTIQVLGGTKGKEKINPVPAHKRIFMTGTPIVNRPKELWPIIHSLDPSRWTSFYKYAHRYCGAYHNGWGWNFNGASNLEELQETLRSTILIRRLKSEVLKELPPKIRQVIELPANSAAQKVIEEEWDVWKTNKEKVEELHRRIDEAIVLKDIDEYRSTVKALQSEVKGLTLNVMSLVRHAVAIAKIPMVIEHLKNVLESGNKVVVFAHHHDVTDALAKEFIGVSVVVDGRVPPSKRMELVDSFQMNDEIRLFIGSTQAAGTGITLTASSHVVFAELDWVPGNLSQAEDRTHRIGQEDSVLVQHLVLGGSLDAHMAKVIVQKQEVIEKALDKVIILHPKEADKPKKKSLETAKPVILPSKKNLMSSKEVSSHSPGLVLEALQFLAERCDGARAIDGNGFNKFDTDFGKDLAARLFLTPGQTEAGFKLCVKYRKQLSDKMKEGLGL
jgi:SWI/SNF-related matrix-associated actin-dependent regulator 1 of chromatin subfamily A